MAWDRKMSFYNKLKNNINENNVKHLFISILISIIILITCFAIIVARVFYPYHKIVAISLYLLSWLFLGYPFLKKILKGHYSKKEVTEIKKKSIIGASMALFLLILYVLIVIFPLNSVKIHNSDIDDFNHKVEKDVEYLDELVKSSDIAVDNFESKNWGEYKVEELTPEKIKELKSDFSRVVDHIILLDSLIEEHRYFYQISILENRRLNYKSFIIGYAAYIERYKLVYDVAKSVNGNDAVKILLNEHYDEFDSDNLYFNFQDRLNNPENLILINSGRGYLEFIKKDNVDLKKKEFEILISRSENTYSYLFGNFDSGIKISAVGALDSYEKHLMTNWLPSQKRIATFLGDTKLSNRHHYYISQEQIKELHSMMEPGDIHFQRRDWYISNSGIPGFWTHSALYVGDIDKLDTYFEAESRELFNDSLKNHIKNNYPDVYEKMNTKHLGEHNITTIEAIGDGVTMLSLEESADSDYFAVVRPRLSKEDKLKAILFAFENYEKPYDYNFDFSSDDSYVCSELIYKAYSSDAGKEGLQYDLYLSSGRWMISPNDMVEDFRDKYNTSEEQTEFILFLDGDSDSGKADFKDVVEFMKTTERGKYNFVS